MKILHNTLNNGVPYTQRVHWQYSVPHNHEYWEAVIIVKGTAHHICNGIQKDESSGQFFLVRPFTDLHSYTTTNKYKNIPSLDYEHRDFFIPVKIMDEAASFLHSETILRDIKSPKYPISLTLTIEQFSSIIDKLNILEREYNNYEYCESICRILTAEILSLYITYFNLDKTKCPKFIQQLILKMHEPDIISGSIDDIVNISGFSHGYLCRTFKKYTNETLSSYLTKIKMKYATHLLINSNLSILEISSCVGYESPANFIIQFKKFSGYTPKDYRKNFI